MKKIIVLIMLLAFAASSASMKTEKQNPTEPIAELCFNLDHVIE